MFKLINWVGWGSEILKVAFDAGTDDGLALAQSVSQLVGESVSESVSESASQRVSQSLCQPVTLSVSVHVYIKSSPLSFFLHIG